MEEKQRRIERDKRLREAALLAATHTAPEPPADDEADDDSKPGQRLEQQALWVDHQIRDAIARGEFDNLPGAGKPIKGLNGTHDPNWWVKGLIEREQITGVLPPALGLRKEDAELEAVIDRESSEPGVRRVVEDFNARVVDAQRQLLGGPPVITKPRDVDAEVEAWRGRVNARREAQRQQILASKAEQAQRRRWWHRRRPGE